MKTQQATEEARTILDVGAAELAVTNDAYSRLSTAKLGSSLAVAIYDPEVKVAGLIVFLLDRWEIDRKRALENPALFANAGIPQLFRQCYNLGADKARMRCYLAGGADPIDPTATYCPGKANRLAALDILRRNDVAVTGQWVGGIESRRLHLWTSDGRLVVESNLREDERA